MTRVARRKPRQRESQLAFEALSIEGGLLSPDWLARAAQLQAGNQAENDYRIPKGLNLRDEIGRYWRIAQAYWSEFAAGKASGAEPRALAERFVPALLHESFGFASLTQVAPVEIAERSYPIGFCALGSRVPVIIAPAGMGLDTLAPVFGDGIRRRSAFGLAQEFLNAADGALWGLATDGLTLRILRDNASMTRPAWIEADLGRIFTEQRYADFAALWLLAHETRFGKPAQPVADCALETWRTAGREEGTRAREHLRRGVEEALLALGQGFLTQPENGALRAALQAGSLTTTAYFQQLLRLVYRLIFLLTVEERGLLHTDAATEAAKHLYAGGYSLRRLRERSTRRSAHDRFSDLWEALKIVFRGLAQGEPRLALPALAGIFAEDECPALEVAKLENRALLVAVFRLSWLKETSGLARVNWRDMGPEELGSVYESLLELVPQIRQGGRSFAFATGDETKGNARKTSGSYYTPDSLVQVLLDSALEPVVQSTIAANPQRPVDALLELAIVDPACGSGHFLLAAARRLAGHVARIQASGTPSAAEYRHALRQVVGHCIYGVDLNPMAVELCKVSLWMEAIEPGLPLTFLNSHIQHGNALIGATPELMAKGVPDAAWDTIEDDDKTTASSLKRRNKQSAAGQRGLDSLWSKPGESESAAVARAVAELEAESDADVSALARKESHWQDILASDAYRHQQFVADAWCAAFMWPKRPGPLAEAAPTNELWRQLRDRQGQPPALTTDTTSALAKRYGFFHWHLAFPHVFARAGFDVVLGNPPWDEVQFEETSWFASREPKVAAAQNAAERAIAIAALETNDPELYTRYRAALRLVNSTKHFITTSRLYPHGSSGKLNTSTLFAELNSRIVATAKGCVGCVVPTGIATDKGTSKLFEEFMSSGRIRSLYDFINESLLFPAVRPHQHFCLLTLGPPRISADHPAEFAAFVHDTTELANAERRYRLNWEEIKALSPEVHSLSLFPSLRHAEVTRKLCGAISTLGRQSGGEDWNPTFQQGTFNVASASELFRTEDELREAGFSFSSLRADRGSEAFVPLFDAKMARQYEWQAASLGFSGNQFRKVSKEETPIEQLCDPEFVPAFAYWVPRPVAEERLGSWDKPWVLGFKDVTGVTSTRLAAFAFVPRMGVGHVFPLLKLASGSAVDHAFMLAWLNSLLVELFLRQRMHGLHLTWHLLSQVPVPRRNQVAVSCPWEPTKTIAEWIVTRVAELSVTSWPLVSLNRELSLAETPYRYDAERRFLLRAEIDAALFMMMGFTALEVEFVLDSLDKIKARDLRLWGEYRTKHMVLQIYEALCEATRGGHPYVTKLDPPPADPRAAQPPDPSKTPALGPTA